MKLRINATTALERRYLEVDEFEVVYCEGNVFTARERIGYDQIDAIVRDHANLAIQVGRRIYKIPYAAGNREHTNVVKWLVEGCRKTLA
jgi:hypothetical protein